MDDLPESTDGEEAYFDGTSQRVNDPLGIGQEERKSKAKEKSASDGSETSKSTNGNLTPEKRSGDKLQPLAASSGH